MSPILVRPVREQLEHDRVIRLLQAKYKRKFEVAINPGNEQTAAVGTAPSQWFPDLVLQSTERSRKLMGVVEVETAESVNNLEAMSQWVAFSKLRVPFHLYVPTSCVDAARRLCATLNVPAAEIWAYQSIGDQLRFALVHKAPGSDAGKTSRSSADGPKARRSSEAPARPAAAAAAKARPVAAAPPAPASSRSSSSTRGRTARSAARRPAASGSTRRPAAKTKTAAPRRAAAKTTARKSPSSRAQKRR